VQKGGGGVHRAPIGERTGENWRQDIRKGKEAVKPAYIYPNAEECQGSLSNQRAGGEEADAQSAALEGGTQSVGDPYPFERSGRKISGP